MHAKWNLHLVLLLCFQLPIELRIIVVESYFPFLQKEIRPLTSTELLEFATKYNGEPVPRISRGLNIIPLGEWDTQIACFDLAMTLRLRIFGNLLDAVVYRGSYATLYENGNPLDEKEILYCNEKVVRLRIDAREITKDTVHEYKQRITSFYRKWVVHAFNEAACFKPRWCSYNL